MPTASLRRVVYTSDYPIFSVTVDAVVLAPGRRVLLVERARAPYAGRLAFPGGFVDIEEDLVDAAVRELREETGVQVEPGQLCQLGAYGRPDRDPRGRTVSVVFVADVDSEAPAVGADDAAHAGWYDTDRVLAEDRLAFDHAEILRDALSR